MRTQAEIVERIKARGPTDPFGWELKEYFIRLDWAHARPFCHPSATESDWRAGLEESGYPLDPRRELLEGLDDCWRYWKEGQCFWLAKRVRWIQSLVWLDNDRIQQDDSLSAQVDQLWDDARPGFAKAILAAVSEFYGYNWRNLWAES